MEFLHDEARDNNRKILIMIKYARGKDVENMQRTFVIFFFFLNGIE